MRLAVLPRAVAARVITSAVARGAWAVNAASVALTIPLLIDFMIEKGIVGALPVPLAILVLLFGLAVGAWFMPRPMVVAGYLAIAAAAAVLLELTMIAAHPAVIADGLFLLNRPAVSLVLIGVAATTTLTGILWCSVGFIVSTLVALVVSLVASVPIVTGWEPTLFFTTYVVAYLVLQSIQASQRRRLPNFDQLEQETSRLALEENLRSRVTALVHDTLLNDLAIVMNAPDQLDERTRSRLREDIATLTSVQWLDESAAVAVVDDQDSTLRNQVMLMISDLQWRGLTVHVTGGSTGIYRLAPEVAVAIVDAVRACLENVLRHAGTTLAEVDLTYTDSEIVVMVSDEGAGFDPDAVAADRLGLRHSVVERIRIAGGSTRIWSTPGVGTTVLMHFPVAEKLSENEKSNHQRADLPEHPVLQERPEPPDFPAPAVTDAGT